MRSIVIFLALIFASPLAAQNIEQRYRVPANEEIIGPRNHIYRSTSAVPPEKDELEGVQVPLPRSDRGTLNTYGNCVWKSLQMLGRYAEIDELETIAERPSRGGDPRCQGGSSPSPVRAYLEDHQIKYEMIQDKSRTDFLEKYCKEQRRGVAIGVPGHILICVHYDPDTKTCKVIDNSDSALAVQTWSWEKFHRMWSGWAYVIFREPDLIPYKYNPWTRIPVVDERGRQIILPAGYFPVP